MNIEENNRLILEFMKLPVNTKQVVNDSRIYYDISQLNLPTCVTIACADQFDFHRSWDWLMPVVEKIEELDTREQGYRWEEDGEIRYNHEGISVEIENGRCCIYEHLALDPLMFYVDKQAETKLEATYNAVVEFLKWLKDENKVTEENQETV